MNSRLHHLLPVGLVLAAVLSTTSAAQPAQATDESLDLLAALGQEAIDALRTDDTVQLVAGGVLVTEPPVIGPTAPEASSSDADAFGEPQRTVTEAEAFGLHSNPGADKVIFLDVDGHTVTGTAWNEGRADEIVVGAYSRERAGQEDESLDSDELAAVVDIWQRVAEDYAPWDIDVTTQDPGPGALSRDGLTDQRYGAHIVITHDSGWYRPSGGVAYVGSFGDSYYAPAFVFSNHLAQGSAKQVGEAASHEAGHTFGLYHDGQVAHQDGAVSVAKKSYYSGHGYWAPIMGVGYGRTITQWSKGDYDHADNTEDDLARIDRVLRRRSVGVTPRPASLATGTTSTTGTLATGGATDTYRVDISDDPTTISLSAADPSSNLLAELVVRNVSTGQSITRTISPPEDPTGWSHVITDLPPGAYDIDVHSIGYGSASTGFTNYASMGRYVLDVDVAGSPLVQTPTTTPPTGANEPGSSTEPDSTTTTVPSDRPDGGTGTTTPPNDNPAPDASALTPISPMRLLDTRSAGAPHRRLAAGDDIRVRVAGIGAVDGDAVAAVINIVAVHPAGNGFLSVTPCTSVADGDRTSSLNFVAGDNIANSTIAPLTDDGDLCVYSSVETDVVIDVTGSIGPSGTVGLATTDVRRIADSRTGTVVPARLLAGERVEIGFGASLAPATTAIALNVTAIRPSGAGFLTVDDCGTGPATTASLNFSTGENRGNNGIFALGSARSICVRTSADVDLTIDLTGEFEPGGLRFVPTNPVRVLDTRTSGTVSPGSTATFEVGRPNSGPAPTAASVNIASTGHPRSGFVTSWDCGVMPESSALNPVAGQVTANGALAALTRDGRSCLFHDAGGDLVVDLNGWWL